MELVNFIIQFLCFAVLGNYEIDSNERLEKMNVNGGEIMLEIEANYQLEEKAKHIERLLTLENVNVTNIQLKTGETIPEHHSKREVIIVVRRGAVLFNLEGGEVVVTQNNILHMTPLENHSLIAKEDTDIIVIQVTP